MQLGSCYNQFSVYFIEQIICIQNKSKILAFSDRKKCGEINLIQNHLAARARSDQCELQKTTYLKVVKTYILIWY